MWPWAEYENGCNDSFTGGKYSTVVYLMFNCSCTSKAVSFNPHLNCRIMMQNACWGCIINTVACFFSRPSCCISMIRQENHQAFKTSWVRGKKPCHQQCVLHQVLFITLIAPLCAVFFLFLYCSLLNMIPIKLSRNTSFNVVNFISDHNKDDLMCVNSPSGASQTSKPTESSLYAISFLHKRLNWRLV